MIQEEEALGLVLDSVQALAAQRVTLLDAIGRFSTADITATIPLPRFDNSAMDGYAVCAPDARPGVQLRVVAEQPAGLDRHFTISPGEAARVFTGAPVPDGTSAVVMQEDVVREEDYIVIAGAVAPDEHIRRAGTDLCAGQKILRTGDEVTPQRAALLASQGMTEVDVGRRPVVAVLATGDEVVPPGSTLQGGQIFESNSTLLAGLVRKAGGEALILGIAPDEQEPLLELLQDGLREDALIISGGVSVGERDLVRTSLEALGAEPALWRVAIKPGKPFLFARAGHCAVFGLPGNPVSAFVTFHRFVLPALRKMIGTSPLGPSPVRVTLGEDVANDVDRPHYIRGRIDAGIFHPVGRQESNALFGLSRSDALLRISPLQRLTTGSVVEAIPV